MSLESYYRKELERERDRVEEALGRAHSQLEIFEIAAKVGRTEAHRAVLSALAKAEERTLTKRKAWGNHRIRLSDHLHDPKGINKGEIKKGRNT